MKRDFFQRRTDVLPCIFGAPAAPNKLQNLISGPEVHAESRINPWTGCHLAVDSAILGFNTHLHPQALPAEPHNTFETSRIPMETDVLQSMRDGPRAPIELQNLMSAAQVH